MFKVNNTLDVSGLPLFNWAKNRNLQEEAHQMWLIGEDGILSSTKNNVESAISESKLMPSEDEHMSMSNIFFENELKIGYNFTYNNIHYRLEASVYIEKRFDKDSQIPLLTSSRVPHLQKIKFFRGYNSIGFKPLENFDFLDINPILAKASIYFQENYLWKNNNSKVA